MMTGDPATAKRRRIPQARRNIVKARGRGSFGFTSASREEEQVYQFTIGVIRLRHRGEVQEQEGQLERDAISAVSVVSFPTLAPHCGHYFVGETEGFDAHPDRPVPSVPDQSGLRQYRLSDSILAPTSARRFSNRAASLRTGCFRDPFSVILYQWLK